MYIKYTSTFQDRTFNVQRDNKAENFIKYHIRQIIKLKEKAYLCNIHSYFEYVNMLHDARRCNIIHQIYNTTHAGFNLPRKNETEHAKGRLCTAES